MSLLAAAVSDVVALSAFGAALLATPERLGLLRGGGRSGTRRSPPPPPGRRVPPLAGRRPGRSPAPGGGWLGAPERLARSARWARPRDLRTLRLPRRPEGATTGRLVLGRAGRTLVAAERAQSVAVFGPTQSGKTSALAVPAILGWEGPVVATSVKTDLVDCTVTHRSRCGPLAVFDPAGTTGFESTPWSPVPASRTWPGARRAASALCDGAKASAGTMTDADFWYASAAKLLAPLLFAAACAGRGIAEVARWVDTQEVDEVLDLLAAAGVPEALDAARASFAREDRQRSSVYTTVETVLAPLVDQAGGGAVRGASGYGAARSGALLDPGGIVDAGGTLYLCAPAHDQRRLQPLFTAVARAAIEHAYDRASATRRPLDPPLLVVLDEAANIAPLSDLDGLAATAAGHGVQLVTVWHDLAQIVARFGPRATTVVNNHRAKVFLSGISDPQTLEYASQLVGDEEVLLPAVTSGGSSGPSTTRSPTTRRLLTAGGVRRLPPGEALLVYGGLPPARLRLRPWSDDAELRARRWAQDGGAPGARARQGRAPEGGAGGGR